MISIVTIKVAVAISLVLLLIYISEKISPKIAGIIGGTAIGGTAVALFFFGIEHGPEFVQEAIPWTIAGLGAEILFYLGYYLGSKIFPREYPLFYHIVGSLFLAFLFFLSMGYALSLMEFSLLSAIGIFLLVYVFVNYFFKHIHERGFLIKHRTKFGEIVFRIVLVTTLILLITSVPSYLGSKWAGIFSAFATTTFPVLLILQYKHGSDACSTVVRNISWSISSLVVYIVSVYYLYPIWGVYRGTLASFLISFVFLLCIKYIFVRLEDIWDREEREKNRSYIEKMNELWFK